MDKINTILRDSSEFEKITKKVDLVMTEAKKKLNDLILAVNQITDSTIFKKITGHVSPGYLYGNCKIHKNEQNPLLRPVISTIPTPGYEVSKVLNSIITPYMPKSHCVNSTKEFLEILKTQTPDNLIASLDVESLFTNVPVQEIIDLIIQYVYMNMKKYCHL